MIRDWLAAVRILWDVRRANRRYLRLYIRYGPSLGASGEEIQEVYRKAGTALVRAASGR